MGRDVLPLTVDRLGDLTGTCADCVFWELGPALAARRRKHPRQDKESWLTATLLEWGHRGGWSTSTAGSPATSRMRRRTWSLARSPSPRPRSAATPPCSSRPGSTRSMRVRGSGGCWSSRRPRTCCVVAARPSRPTARAPDRRRACSRRSSSPRGVPDRPRARRIPSPPARPAHRPAVARRGRAGRRTAAGAGTRSRHAAAGRNRAPGAAEPELSAPGQPASSSRTLRRSPSWSTPVALVSCSPR